MKDLLQKEYPAFFKVMGKYVISSFEKEGDFALNDEKACSECRAKGVQQCSDSDSDENMLVHSDHALTIVDIESFLIQFDGKRAGVRERCDKMLYDARKIVFVDFYCGLQKYVPPYTNTRGDQPGKLAKARHQINSTVEKICELPAINERMAEYTTKEGIFACRIKSRVTDTSLLGAPSMETFLMSTPQMEGYTAIAQGFRFRMLEFPTKYEW